MNLRNYTRTTQCEVIKDSTERNLTSLGYSDKMISGFFYLVLEPTEDRALVRAFSIDVGDGDS